MVVVPVEEQFQFSHNGTAPKGNQDEPSTLNLHGLDESLQNGDTSVLADGPEALGDSFRTTPFMHLVVGKLCLLIRYEILGLGSYLKDDAIEQGDDGLRIRPSIKHFKPLYST